MVRGKFMVVEITEYSWSATARKITFRPEYDSTLPEDQKYAKSTPSGEISMTVDNPPAIEQLKLGKKFYVDFTEVPEALPKEGA